jgi:hypothetical protein
VQKSRSAAAQPGIATDRFAREIVVFWKALLSALAAAECQTVGPPYQGLSAFCCFQMSLCGNVVILYAIIWNLVHWFYLSRVARMYTLVVPPDSPCGCGSGRAFGDCCLHDGKITLSPKSITSPAPITGQSISNCFFNSNNDCGGGMSGDHLISAAVLRQITTEKITITGTGFSRSVYIQDNSLKIKWLCRRHNAALSPLDTLAARLFQAVLAADFALAQGIIPNQRLYLFEGFDIERWLLKTLLAAYYGRISNIVPETHTLPDYTTQLFDHYLPLPLGLYVQTHTREDGQHTLMLARQASLYLITEGTLVTGIAVSLSGLELKLLIAGNPNSLQSFSHQHVVRPSHVNFFQGDNVIGIATVWMQGSDTVVWISRGDPNAPLPQDPR